MRESLAVSKYDFRIVCGVRTAQEQGKLYLKGRSLPGIIVTNADGIEKISNHQLKKNGFGYAVDIYPFIDNIARNDYQNYKEEFNEIAKNILKTAVLMKKSIVWGGFWIDPFDPPHFELKDK